MTHGRACDALSGGRRRAAVRSRSRVDRAYLQERARRRARIERSRARRRAALRFWLVLLGLIAISVLLTLTIWREVERLFGL